MKDRVCKWFFVLGLIALPSISAAAQAPTGGLRIVSPSNGGVVEPGQPFTVVVEPEPGVSPTAVALLSPSIFTFKEQPPFTYVVSVPSGAALGPEKLVADGIDARERSFRAEITLNIETATPIASIRVDPSDLFLGRLPDDRSLSTVLLLMARLESSPNHARSATHPVILKSPLSHLMA